MVLACIRREVRRSDLEDAVLVAGVVDVVKDQQVAELPKHENQPARTFPADRCKPVGDGGETAGHR